VPRSPYRPYRGGNTAFGAGGHGGCGDGLRHEMSEAVTRFEGPLLNPPHGGGRKGGGVVKPIHSVLLATDFKPASREAEPVAVRLAATFGARVTLLHALEPLPAWPAGLHPRQGEMTRALGQRAEALSARGGRHEFAVTVAPPAEAILHKARQVGADLILMGAGSRSPFDRFCPGSVAKAVLRHAAGPVLLVRPGEPAASFGTILCVVDRSAASAAGLRYAAQLARAFDGRLIVLTVVPEAGWLIGGAAERERLWLEEFERALEGTDLAGGFWEKEVRRGTPHRQIVQAARERQADLLVLGSAGPGGWVRLLRAGVAHRLLPELPCSLLATPGGIGPEAAPDIDGRSARAVGRGEGVPVSVG
jgi:nucleotide-binding universal stress UspA family protein